MKLNRFLLVISALPGIFLFGCSQQFSAVNESLKAVMIGSDDVVVTNKDIQSIPYATSYVRIDDGPQILMVLAFAEPDPETGHTLLKWVSEDKRMIVTDQGRIVKTLRLSKDNLAHINTHGFSNMWNQAQSWEGSYSWSNHSGYKIHSKGYFIYQGNEPVDGQLWIKQTTRWQEYVKFPLLNRRITNTYWVDANHQVVKTIQTLGPGLSTIEMTFLKPYADVSSNENQ